jgi:hypothetical protein
MLALLAIPIVLLPATALAAGDAESDSFDGSSALRQLAEANGHHTALLTDQFNLPTNHGVLFIIEPDSPFRASEAQDVARWVSEGGVLVYASAFQEPELELSLDISRASDTGSFAPRAHPATPLLAGANNVAMGALLPFATPSTSQTVYLRTSTDIAGLQGVLGQGQFFALASANPLTNQLLDTDDNAAAAADLIAAAGPGATVTFDQFHHGGGAGQSGSFDWVGLPWGFAIVLEVLLVFVLLALRGRAFGPLVPLRPAGDPSSAEFTRAVGAMLRRARASRQTVGRLLQTTRAAIAEQVGIRGNPAALEEVLEQRSPALADDLASASARASRVRDDATLAEAAAELHRLARPSLGEAPPIQKKRRTP